jgi:hypothetical protein
MTVGTVRRRVVAARAGLDRTATPAARWCGSRSTFRHEISFRPPRVTAETVQVVDGWGLAHFRRDGGHGQADTRE